MQEEIKTTTIKTRIKNRLGAIGILIIGAMTISSCGGNQAYYEEYISIPGQKWHRDNVPYFEFQIDDTTQRYDMSFNIRHNKAFEWQNIWVFVTFEVPGGQMDRDTLEFVLQDAQGRWLGSGSGDIRDGSFLFKHDFRFPLIGKYKASFEQAMRTEVLEDVTDIGLKIEELEG